MKVAAYAPWKVERKGEWILVKNEIGDTICDFKGEPDTRGYQAALRDYKALVFAVNLVHQVALASALEDERRM